jgi:hypothetical protein
MTTTERYAHMTQNDLRATIALFAQAGQQVFTSAQLYVEAPLPGARASLVGRQGLEPWTCRLKPAPGPPRLPLPTPRSNTETRSFSAFFATGRGAVDGTGCEGTGHQNPPAWATVGQRSLGAQQFGMTPASKRWSRATTTPSGTATRVGAIALSFAFCPAGLGENRDSAAAAGGRSEPRWRERGR